MKHQFENIADLQDITERIRNWTSFQDEDIYDHGGLIQIFAACLENLRRHSIPVDFEELADRLSDEEIEVLLKLASAVQAARRDR